MCNFQSCWITLLDWKLLENDEIINYLKFTESLWTTYIRCEADEDSSWMEISWENNMACSSDISSERKLTILDSHISILNISNAFLVSWKLFVHLNTHNLHSFNSDFLLYTFNWLSAIIDSLIHMSLYSVCPEFTIC